MAAPKKVDYDRIEPDWRAGVKSLPQMAADYTKATGVVVTYQSIMRHFNKLGVPRDLGAKVRAKADALVLASMVINKGTSKSRQANEQTVNDTAAVIADVRITHRTDIGRARKVSMSLLTELEGQTNDPEMLAELGELMRAPDRNGIDRMNDIYQKIISSTGRIDSMKKLADTLKTLIALEREAYNINVEPDAANEKIPSGLGHFYGQSSGSADN